MEIFDVYLHTEKQFHSSLRSKNITLLRILQFDWPRVLASVHPSKIGTLLTALMKAFIYVKNQGNLSSLL